MYAFRYIIISNKTSKYSINSIQALIIPINYVNIQIKT